MPFRAPLAGLSAGILLALLVSPPGIPRALGSEIPDEGAIALAGDRVMAAVVGDVDGDGVRELVRLLPFSVNPGQQAVEVLSIRDEQVVSGGDVLIERAATPDPPDVRRRPSPENLLPLGVNEPARLIAWRLDGRERVLLASIGTVGLVRPCCLTLWQVGLDAGRTTLGFLQDTIASAASILAQDLDEDGTDELVMLESPLPDDPGLPTQRVVVLRWNGAAFDRLFGTAQGNYAQGPLFALGDSDGLPGNEVGFLGDPRFDQVVPTLYRIRLSADGGQVRVEHTLLPEPGELAPVPTPDGGQLAIVGEELVSIIDWPADQPSPDVVFTAARGGRLLGVVGTGPLTRLLVVRGSSLDVLIADLTSLGGIFVTRASVNLVTDPTAWQPYLGELPGGAPVGGGGEPHPAFVFGGWLISSSPDASKALLEVEMAALPDMAPLGFFGPGLGWAVTANRGAAIGHRLGGPMEVASGGFASAVWVVPAAQLLRPEVDDGVLAPPLTGAVPALDGSEQFLTRESVDAEIIAPPGSALRVTAVSPESEQVVNDGIGDAGRTRARLVTSTQHGEAFQVRLQLVTPAGHGYTARWQIRIVRDPPPLDVDVPMAPFTFDVPVSGRTIAWAVVEVDGRSAGLAPDGSFATTVSAGLVPRTVLVRATDMLGNTAERRVSVVGWLDYRQLPWVLIIAALTVGLVFLHYLRTPQVRRQRNEGEGTLEELD